MRRKKEKTWEERKRKTAPLLNNIKHNVTSIPVSPLFHFSLFLSFSIFLSLPFFPVSHRAELLFIHFGLFLSPFFRLFLPFPPPTKFLLRNQSVQSNRTHRKVRKGWKEGKSDDESVEGRKERLWKVPLFGLSSWFTFSRQIIIFRNWKECRSWHLKMNRTTCDGILYERNYWKLKEKESKFWCGSISDLAKKVETTYLEKRGIIGTDTLCLQFSLPDREWLSSNFWIE